MRIVIATVRVPFVRGGAEFLADELEQALLKRGHKVEILSIPFKWYPPDRIPDHILACRLLDVTEASAVPIDLMIGLKFPAYHMKHSNKVLWLLHQHRQAYDLWDHPEASDLRFHPNGSQARAAIRASDEHFIPEAKAVYTISKNVSERLSRYCGIPSEPLYHPPPQAESLFCAEPEDYLFYPSRIGPLKRQKLVIEALASTKERVRVVFAGTPEYPPYAEQLERLAVKLGVADRVEWLGPIPNEAKADYYARCIGVIFPPVDEDYGYVTLEAMLASKTVITCDDSGGPKEFIINRVTGSIVEPAAPAIAAAMDELWSNRAASREMGRAAYERYHDMRISWDTVTRSLTA